MTYNPNANGLPGPISQPAATDNRSTTVRINYDQTLTPTLLLHLGVGYLYTLFRPALQHFDQTTLGLKRIPRPDHFPNFPDCAIFFTGGVNLSSSPFGGGVVGPGGFLQEYVGSEADRERQLNLGQE